MDLSQASTPQTSENFDGRKCPHCGKQFASISSANRHVRKIHLQAINMEKQKHILCPSVDCRELLLRTFNDLNKHIEEYHKVCLQKLVFSFSSREQYDEWMKSEKIDSNFVLIRTRQEQNYKQKEYSCNRSDLKGYQKAYKKRTEKSGGTIKICGVCPSRLIVGLLENGEVTVTFQKTHFGHEEEVRTQHLSQMEKEEVLGKLKCGIPTDRILADARQPDKGKLERRHLLNRKDVDYLYKKHNIGKKRDKNEMVAVTLKVEEWNKNRQNFAFFFQKTRREACLIKGRRFCYRFHELYNERQAVKLQPNHMYGWNTLHKQQRDGFNDNARALQKEMGQNLQPTYFMTDDDPKYYNAWVKIMGNRPRRLLCTWHVIKNWNIQGRAKIKDVNMKEMKGEMKKILNECNEERFKCLANAYLKKLEEANEKDFLYYLKRYYFIDEERIQMWAHCYRRNAGINTNMAVESLNNFLKSNQLKRRTKVTVEKLLDSLEELVDIKMWHRISSIERPSAGNYQDRIVIKAHKKAEEMINTTEVIEESFGQFKVKSSNGNQFYKVVYNEICESECRTLFCRVCKVCVHRYQCECPEYAVRNTMCKHIHMVCMYEQRRGSNYVTDAVVEMLNKEESEIKKYHQEEIKKFVEEKIATEDVTIDEETKRNIEDENILHFLKGLNHEAHKRVIGKFHVIMKEEQKTSTPAPMKRKMEKQEYYPAKR